MLSRLLTTIFQSERLSKVGARSMRGRRAPEGPSSSVVGYGVVEDRLDLGEDELKTVDSAAREREVFGEKPVIFGGACEPATEDVVLMSFEPSELDSVLLARYSSQVTLPAVAFRVSSGAK